MGIYDTLIILIEEKITVTFLFHFKDATMETKFTDVDYRVFTDAARHIYRDGSPYNRHTYRYTPLLAWMLIPNVTLSPLFGKFLFCGFDIIAGHLIHSYVQVGRLIILTF